MARYMYFEGNIWIYCLMSAIIQKWPVPQTFSDMNEKNIDL